MAAVTVHSDVGAQEKKICHCFHFSPSICHEVMGQDTMILVFWMLSFQLAFSLSALTLIKRLFSSSFCHYSGIICISEVIDISPKNLDSSLYSFSLAFCTMCSTYRASQVAQWVKNPPAMQETQERLVQSLGQEVPLEEDMGIHSSTLAWRIPLTEEPGRLQSIGFQRVGHDWSESACTHALHIN